MKADFFCEDAGPSVLELLVFVVVYRDLYIYIYESWVRGYHHGCRAFANPPKWKTVAAD